MKAGFLEKLIERLGRIGPEDVQNYFLRLAQEKGFLETVFNAIQEGIIVADSKRRHKQGHRLPVAVRVQPIRGRDGSVEGAVEIFSNNYAEVIAERRVKEMKQMALIDHLTQLPNRRYLEKLLESAHQEFRAEGVRFGVLVIDVDHFKAINDTFGHRWGDIALQEIGKDVDVLHPVGRCAGPLGRRRVRGNHQGRGRG